MASLFEKDRGKIRVITDNDMLMMVEKGIGGGICQAVYRYAKANNKYMNDFNKDIEPWYLEYLYVCMNIYIFMNGQCLKNYQ